MNKWLWLFVSLFLLFLPLIDIVVGVGFIGISFLFALVGLVLLLRTEGMFFPNKKKEG